MGDVAIAGLVGELERAGVVIDPSVLEGGLSATTRQLSEIEFSVQSSCGDLKVWYAASGVLREVVIADGALKRHDNCEMASLILKTVTTAERLVVDAVTEVTRRQLRGRSR